MQFLQMNEGGFPFRYLGVPLHMDDCKILVDRVTTKLQAWSVKLLSFTGKVEVVRCVLGGIKNFWCQIFCIPNEVIRLIDSACRCFIWTGK